MGTCLSKKKDSSSTPFPGAVIKSVTTGSSPAAELKTSANGVTLSKPKVEIEQEVNLKKNTVQENEGLVKKEIFIIKHRKSHDDNRDRSTKCSPVDGVGSYATSEAAELITSKKILVPEVSGTMGLGVRTSSCTKEEVDAILIHCGRLSRNSSGKAASSSAAASGERKYSGSKRSYDFDHCDNDTTSADDDQRKINNDFCEDDEKSLRRQRHRQSPRKPSSQGRRRTPSRERDQNQRSSSMERRVSRSPGRRSSETSSNVTANGAASASAINGGGARPGKMVSVPATVSSLAMDKSNNGGVGGESAANKGIRRISVKRNVGETGEMVGSRSAASPRSQSPARANRTVKVFGDNQFQQQPSLSRNSSRKAENSPYRRNPLSEIDPNSRAYLQTANNNSNVVQNRNKKEIETEATQTPDIDMNDDNNNTISNGVGANFKTKEQLQEDDGKGQPSMTENIIVKTMVSSGLDNPKPQTLTRSRSSRRSRDLDFNPEALLNPGQSYTSLLLEDIQNFHQKNAPSVSLPACVTKACSILEAVADLNSTTGPNLSGAAFSGNRSPPIHQSFKNQFNTPLDGNNRYTKEVTPDTKDPFLESEVAVCDDVMEPSLHRYVTVRRGGSLGGLDSEDQESSGSNSYTVSSQQHWGTISSSSWEPNSADSRDSWTSRLNTREEVLKSPLGLQASFSSQADRDPDEGKKNLNGRRRECNHQHSSGIGRGRLGDANKDLHTLPVATAAVST